MAENSERLKITAEASGTPAMKPTVIMIGADKGGTGKTTIARTLLDYFAARNTLARAFDSEFPRGTLKRFHPGVTEIVNITVAPDQMKMIDTLASSPVRVSVIDVRAGLLSPTLERSPKSASSIWCGQAN